jgi:hypothetical protein
MWPSHPNLCALIKFIMFLCFVILSNSIYPITHDLYSSAFLVCFGFFNYGSRLHTLYWVSKGNGESVRIGKEADIITNFSRRTE